MPCSCNGSSSACSLDFFALMMVCISEVRTTHIDLKEEHHACLSAMHKLYDGHCMAAYWLWVRVLSTKLCVIMDFREGIVYSAKNSAGFCGNVHVSWVGSSNGGSSPKAVHDSN